MGLYDYIKRVQVLGKEDENMHPIVSLVWSIVTALILIVFVSVWVHRALCKRKQGGNATEANREP